MVGLVWGAYTEFQTGELMISQAQHVSLPAILMCLLFTYATMVPVMHSARMEPFGFFTPRCAPCLNCRCVFRYNRKGLKGQTTLEKRSATSLKASADLQTYLDNGLLYCFMYLLLPACLLPVALSCDLPGGFHL